VVRTRKPGGTPVGEQIRHVLLSPEFEGLDPRAEALLFAAARGEHVARVIRPALERGDVVICDRYVDSSVAYQGYGRDLGPTRVRDLSLWATRELLPNLTVVLDVDPEVGLARFAERDRLEAEPLEYHQAVRAAFLALAEAEPDRYLVLDARGDIDDLAAAILARVESGLEAR
jgi:dTMP kinase